MLYEIANKISLRYYRLYLFGALIWGIWGLSLFPKQVVHIALIVGAIVSLIMTKDYTEYNNKTNLFILCLTICMAGLVIVFFNIEEVLIFK